MADAAPTTETFDVVVVGAGFSGLYLLHRLRGLGLRTVVIEAGDGVGGTWYWNRYPGARVDVVSTTYSYSFDEDLQQEWSWTERYASQAEILRYVDHVADRFDLRRDIRLATRVVAATYDEARSRWTVATDRGDAFDARFCVMATGCLSAPRPPDFPGLESFQGDWYHTGLWPHEEVDFTGRRVGVVGTGSSAIQSIPVIARQAAHLTVFQRTANFSIPAWNAPLDPEHERTVKESYAFFRQKARLSPIGDTNDVSQVSALDVSDEEREAVFEDRWRQGGFAFLIAFSDLLTDERANAYAADFVHRKIREQVHDQEVAELLCPKDHPFGTKRLCVDTGYYATYNRDNVTLVDVRSAPIVEISPTGIRTKAAHHELDTIVFATGFDAMTGALSAIDVRGCGGEALADLWAAGPQTYLGVAVAGFPNLFLVTGPGSPSVLSNMMVSIEQHVDWIADCIARLVADGVAAIEPDLDAQEQWGRHVVEVGDTTLYPRAASWYVGANVPGKPRVFMPYVGGVGAYRELCDEVAAVGYRGFVLAP